MNLANVNQPKSISTFHCRLVNLSVDQLHPHPSYVKHQLSVSAPQLAVLSAFGDLVFQEPITVTRAGTVVDGYARWELARRQRRQFILCLEYDLSSEEALEGLIRARRPSCGSTDFVRIELALDLEPHFREKALMNQQAGGKDKGSSKLTEAQQVDTRREVARIACVSSGNVRKVKHILAHACTTLLQAARTKEVSINLAEKWSHEPEGQQQEHLRVLQIERGVRRKARRLIAAHLEGASPSTRDRRVMKLSEFVGLVNQFNSGNQDQTIDVGSVEVQLLDAPGPLVFVTQELVHFLTPLQGVLPQ